MMQKKDKAKLVQKILNDLFPDPKIPLNAKDPYTLLVAVLLSAQCTDARVNQITPKLFRLAASPNKMILLTPKKIEEIIRPCGLGPTKSRAIWKLSQDLLDRFEGKVPRSMNDLLSLPGIGRKTASVVMTAAFHLPAFPVDTHIFRCARRWALSRGKTPAAVEKDLKNLFPKDSWIKVHLQIIYFARKFCPARGHVKASCPICSILH